MRSRVSDNQLRGVITPLLTPFFGDGTVDYGSLDKLAHHVIEGGVSGLFILGTTGEGPCIKMEGRYEIVKRVVDFTAGQVPVFISLTDTVFDNSVRLAKYAEELGADALVITPPPYFSSSQAELLSYFETLSSITELPCYLYNIPSLTKVSIEPETVLQASKLPRIVGIKDSSGDMTYFNKVRELMKGVDGFSFFMGPEELMAEAVLLGAQGGVNGGSNLFPHLYVSLYNAAAEGDQQRVKELRSIVINISAQLYSLSGFENHCVRVVKYLLSLFGICGETMARPYQELDSDKKQIARERLEAIILELNEAGISAPTLSLTH